MPGSMVISHAGLEHAPDVADLVVADIMHIHAEPVTGAMHEELRGMAAILDQLGHAALEQAEVLQAPRDHASTAASWASFQWLPGFVAAMAA
jgi:hypothetical protein